MAERFIYELLIVLTGGLLASLMTRRLKVPSVIGYLVVGALLGQGALGVVSAETHELEYLAEAGVFLLLFAIGLELSMEELLRMGRQLVVGGALQMLFTALPTMAVLWCSGFRWQASLFLAMALAFSSTVLVFQALSETGRAGTRVGRRAIGILLFQDAALVPLLMAASIFMGDPPTLLDFALLAVKSLLFLVAVVGLRRVMGQWLLPQLTIYRSPEIVVLFSLVALGSITLGAHGLGLPPAVGAFAAGLILGGSRLTSQIDALLLPFRETYAAVFFVSLGLGLNLASLLQAPLLMLASLVAIVAVKTAAATLALRLTGLPWKQAAGMGVGLAHVGEFALVLLVAATGAGLVSAETGEQFLALTLGTLFLSPLLMQVGLRWSGSETESVDPGPQRYHAQRAESLPQRALVVGMGPVGTRVASQLESLGYEVTLIDRSPINLQRFAQLGFRTLAGDASEESLLTAAEVETCRQVVICVPNDPVAYRIVERTRDRNTTAEIYVRCRYASNVQPLLRIGATEVVSEEATASLKLLELINRHTN